MTPSTGGPSRPRPELAEVMADLPVDLPGTHALIEKYGHPISPWWYWKHWQSHPTRSVERTYGSAYGPGYRRDL